MFVDKLSSSDREALVEELMSFYKKATPVNKKHDFKESSIKLEKLLRELSNDDSKLLKNIIKTRLNIDYRIENSSGKVTNYNISIYDFTVKGHTNRKNLDDQATQYLRFFLSNKFGKEYVAALSRFDIITSNYQEELSK